MEHTITRMQSGDYSFKVMRPRFRVDRMEAAMPPSLSRSSLGLLKIEVGGGCATISRGRQVLGDPPRLTGDAGAASPPFSLYLEFESFSVFEIFLGSTMNQSKAIIILSR
ncbi:hypothetical protein NL676_001755 [Syzygium grande]|nr:hypothetical protein NL676_001755 [Syzygium grande]